MGSEKYLQFYVLNIQKQRQQSTDNNDENKPTGHAKNHQLLPKTATGGAAGGSEPLKFRAHAVKKDKLVETMSPTNRRLEAVRGGEGEGGLLWPKIAISYGGLSRRRPYWAQLPRTGADGSLATFLPRNVRHSGSANTLIMCAIGSIVCCSRLVRERLKHRRLFAPALAVLSALIGQRRRGVCWGHSSRIDVLLSVSLVHFVPSKYFEMSFETG